MSDRMPVSKHCREKLLMSETKGNCYIENERETVKCMLFGLYTKKALPYIPIYCISDENDKPNISPHFGSITSVLIIAALHILFQRNYIL